MIGRLIGRALRLAPIALLAPLLAGAAAQGARGAGPRYVDVTKELGIDFKHEASPTTRKYLPETMGSGVAVLDFDGDSRLDLFFVNGARIVDPMPKGALPVKASPRYWHRLYRQRADGGFDDVTEPAGVAGTGYGMGAAVGDADNDCDPDLFVTGVGANSLFRNNGDGTFANVTAAAGVAGGGWSTSATFLDFDRDGRLDLFVCRYLDWSFDMDVYCGERRPGYRAYCHPDQFRGAAPLLYRNEGGLRFVEVSKKAGVASDAGKGLGVAIADFDRDGWIDIFVANDSTEQFLFRNRGDGGFEEVALLAGGAFNEDGKAFAGMGVDFADYDNDGLSDVVVTNLANDRYALYRNLGDATFAYATQTSNLGRITQLHTGWGARFLDYDHDGWKDLFVAQGHVLDTVQLTAPHLRYLEPPLLARNEGGRAGQPPGFTDVSARSGDVFSSSWAGRGMATGDLDGDGDLDVVVTTTNGRAYVLRNDGGNTVNWLQVRLVGTKSNRDGLGAEVTVTRASGPPQLVTVTTGGSYLSASDSIAHFGLGADSAAKSVEVRWPNGAVQRLREVAANRIVRVVEP